MLTAVVPKDTIASTANVVAQPTELPALPLAQKMTPTVLALLTVIVLNLAISATQPTTGVVLRSWVMRSALALWENWELVSVLKVMLVKEMVLVTVSVSTQALVLQKISLVPAETTRNVQPTSLVTVDSAAEMDHSDDANDLLSSLTTSRTNNFYYANLIYF